MAKAKFVALTSFDLGHRIIAAGDTLFTMEAPSEADLHFFRARIGWSAFRVIVDEAPADAPAADTAPADAPPAAATDAPPADASGDAPAKGKRKA